MKTGTMVTYQTRNPNYKTSRFGVVVPGESDLGVNYVLVAEGALSIEQAKSNDFQIVNCLIEELTPVSEVLVKQLKV